MGELHPTASSSDALVVLILRFVETGDVKPDVKMINGLRSLCLE